MTFCDILSFQMIHKFHVENVAQKKDHLNDEFTIETARLFIT